MWEGKTVADAIIRYDITMPLLSPVFALRKNAMMTVSFPLQKSQVSP